ncbi:MAG TPA: class II aldolase/adducin family protein, partial [Gammaproteobacteria bacterium]|nr:class II aldolase/adducin family protein [Gammaproteobacteria bacterium]
MAHNGAHIHPRNRIADVLRRIYADRMTTTSGGNLSIRDDDGDIWITPAATDKGVMQPDDIVRRRADGATEGRHRPSSELPFHEAIYARRPDLRAIIHAHPPAMVAFSIVRETPDTAVLPQASHICGEVGYAPYDIPGSAALGKRIAEGFAGGSNAVIMENHGTVIGGTDMDDAFRRFTTLELCAEAIIRGRRIGEVRALPTEEIRRYDGAR